MRMNKRSFVVEVRRALGKPSGPKAGSLFSISDQAITKAEQAQVKDLTNPSQGKEDQQSAHPRTGRILPALDQMIANRELSNVSPHKNKQAIIDAQEKQSAHIGISNAPDLAASKERVLENNFEEDTSHSVANLPTLKRMKRRRSKILARYVFGTLPHRGERWKLRLRFS